MTTGNGDTSRCMQPPLAPIIFKDDPPSTTGSRHWLQSSSRMTTGLTRHLLKDETKRNSPLWMIRRGDTYRWMQPPLTPVISTPNPGDTYRCMQPPMAPVISEMTTGLTRHLLKDDTKRNSPLWMNQARRHLPMEG